VDYVLGVLTLIAIWVIAVHGYMLIKGLGGLLHLGHAVFFGLGAYTAAILSREVLPAGAYPASLLAAALVAGAGAVAIGVPALRARGRYFMLVTFSIQLAFFTVVSNLHGLTGGPDGLSRIPRPQLGAWTVAAPGATLALVVGLAVLSFLFCHLTIRSPYGRLVRAVRDDEIAAEGAGKRAAAVKLSIFVLGAGVTGFAGGVFAHYMRYVGPTQFGLDLVVLFLVMLVLGGQFNLLGVTVGAVTVGVMIEALRFAPLPRGSEAFLHQVLFGGLLIAILFIRPEGLLPERLPRHRRPAGGGPPARVEAVRAHRREAPDGVALRAEGLVKRFGGVTALDGCTLDLARGRITAIIGPNGAGKTTVFNLVTGFVRPDAGRIHVGAQELTGWTPERIAALGVARTFQDVRIWPRLTVIENVLAAMRWRRGERPVLGLPILPGVRAEERQHVERAWALLERFGLQDKADDPGGALSYAQQKMLALARLTALDPAVMLLDEPTAGVDVCRLGTFLDHIQRFSAQQGRTVCLIEHNMDVVRELADHVLFMNDGRVVAEGRPEEVMADQELMAIYLGHAPVEA